VVIPAFFLYDVVANPNLIVIGALVALQVLIAVTVGYLTIFAKEERRTILMNVLRACRWEVKEPSPAVENA